MIDNDANATQKPGSRTNIIVHAGDRRPDRENPSVSAVPGEGGPTRSESGKDIVAAPPPGGQLAAPATGEIGPPAIFPAGFDAELRDDLAGAYSLATRRAYRADWRDFQAWCERTSRTSLPAAARDVRDYLADLAAGKKLSTLRRRLAAIARAHKLAGLSFDVRDPIITNVMRRLARELGAAQHGRAPLMTVDIRKMIKALPNNLMGLRDRAVLLLGFASSLRRSELVALEVRDLEFRREGVLISIRRSKGDQEGRGQQIGVVYGKRELTCPVRALQRWLDQAKISEGPIFRPVEYTRPANAVDKALLTVGTSALTPLGIARIVKRSATRAGIAHAAALSAHSLRSGHVTQALENGADPLKAKEQARHRRLETTLVYNKAATFKANSSGKLDL